MTAKSGDLYVIQSANGSAYLQFVKTLSRMGQMIRVFPGIYPNEPPDLTALVSCETNFWIFFPVNVAQKRGIIRKVANFDLPEHARQSPIFRAGVRNPATKKVESWWLWDGKTEWEVGALTQEQRKLPIRGTWNDTLLIQRIEEGWLPENDPR